MMMRIEQSGVAIPVPPSRRQWRSPELRELAADATANGVNPLTDGVLSS